MSKALEGRARSRTATLLALAALAIAWPCAAQPAGSDPDAGVVITDVGARLSLSPKRLTFVGPRRSATVYVHNGGPAATFDVTLVDRMMGPDGLIVSVDEARQSPALGEIAARVRSARAMIAVSPRRLALGPGEGATLRISLTGDEAAVAGEFRTHLTVSAMPPAEVGLSADAAAAGHTGEPVQLKALWAFSIPVIVRPEATDARAAIENAQVRRSPAGGEGPVLAFDLVRLGASSLFGNLVVRKRAGGVETQLFVLRGVGLYPEISRRRFKAPLGAAVGDNDVLEVVFVDDDVRPGEMLASHVLPAAQAAYAAVEGTAGR
ncbi:hypothetical protein [Phenylobacterium sp.]|uniref:hypothetical protein n=1 Tax=Phenylobacterium sp. TaxID=1871053 RepID=UPI003982EBA0